jgi:hypothetical protein
MSAKTPAIPSRGARRAAIGVFVVLAAILAAHAVAWRWVTGAMAVGFSDWVAQRRAEGWAVEHGIPARGGWPFAARITVPAVAVAGPTHGQAQGFAWAAERVVLAIAPPRLDRLLVAPEGPQRLDLGGGSFPFAAERLELEVPIEPGPGPRPVALRIAGLRATLPAGPLSLERLDASMTPAEAGGSLLLSAWAEGAALPPSPLAAAFGPRLDSAGLEGRLTGPVVAAPGLPPAMRAEAWRRAGGGLDVARLALRWGPLRGEGSGLVRLDAALQPDVVGTLVLEGGAEALGALARAGLVAPRAAMAGQAAIGVMGRAPPGGGAPRVELPVGLAGGVLSIARVPILRVPPLTWSQGR